MAGFPSFLKGNQKQLINDPLSAQIKLLKMTDGYLSGNHSGLLVNCILHSSDIMHRSTLKHIVIKMVTQQIPTMTKSHHGGNMA